MNGGLEPYANVTPSFLAELQSHDSLPSESQHTAAQATRQLRHGQGLLLLQFVASGCALCQMQAWSVACWSGVRVAAQQRWTELGVRSVGQPGRHHVRSCFVVYRGAHARASCSLKQARIWCLCRRNSTTCVRCVIQLQLGHCQGWLFVATAHPVMCRTWPFRWPRTRWPTLRLQHCGGSSRQTAAHDTVQLFPVTSDSAAGAWHAYTQALGVPHTAMKRF